MLLHACGNIVFKLFLVHIGRVLFWSCLKKSLSILLTCGRKSQAFLWMNWWARNAGYISSELDTWLSDLSPKFLSNNVHSCEVTCLSHQSTPQNSSLFICLLFMSDAIYSCNFSYCTITIHHTLVLLYSSLSSVDQMPTARLYVDVP